MKKTNTMLSGKMRTGMNRQTVSPTKLKQQKDKNSQVTLFVKILTLVLWDLGVRHTLEQRKKQFLPINLSLQNYVTLESSTTVSVRVYQAFDFRILLMRQQDKNSVLAAWPIGHGRGIQLSVLLQGIKRTSEESWVFQRQGASKQKSLSSCWMASETLSLGPGRKVFPFSRKKWSQPRGHRVAWTEESYHWPSRGVQSSLHPWEIATIASLSSKENKMRKKKSVFCHQAKPILGIVSLLDEGFGDF